MVSMASPEDGETERVAEWGDGSAVIETLDEDAPASLVAESLKVCVRWGERELGGRMRLMGVV